MKIKPFPWADVMLQSPRISWCRLYCKLSLTGHTVYMVKCIKYKLQACLLCTAAEVFIFKMFLFCTCAPSDWLWICLKKQKKDTAVTSLLKSCIHFVLAMGNMLGWTGVVMDSGNEQQLVSLITWDNALYRLTPYYSSETNAHVGCIRDIKRVWLLLQS